ncbi:MAG: PaREP1 family protein [Methanophagales archaeon]|nr:PaREP1 family protein [Methanophagales archaeon]
MTVVEKETELVSAKGRKEAKGLFDAGANYSCIDFFNEGKGYIERNDPVQASEKLYKAAEEAIKLLSATRAPGIYKEAMEKGNWTKNLLFRAAFKMGREIRRCWSSAWTLHVEGFHEMALKTELVKDVMEDIEELVKFAER